MTEADDLLLQFFGGYFHQDLDLMYSDPEEAFKSYLADHSVEEINALIGALEGLLHAVTDDRALELKLLRSFGCAYDPGSAGMTYRQWLESITSKGREEIARRRA